MSAFLLAGRPEGRDERCRHELIVDQCGLCSPRAESGAPDPFSSPGPVAGLWFAARYAGECSRCGDWFAEGEEIQADGEGGYLARCCGLGTVRTQVCR
jgi:hypothetical protein